jgi:hypothetical protein
MDSLNAGWQGVTAGRVPALVPIGESISRYVPLQAWQTGWKWNNLNSLRTTQRASTSNSGDSREQYRQLFSSAWRNAKNVDSRQDFSNPAPCEKRITERFVKIAGESSTPTELGASFAATRVAHFTNTKSSVRKEAQTQISKARSRCLITSTGKNGETKILKRHTRMTCLRRRYELEKLFVVNAKFAEILKLTDITMTTLNRYLLGGFAESIMLKSRSGIGRIRKQPTFPLNMRVNDPVGEAGRSGDTQGKVNPGRSGMRRKTDMPKTKT